MMCQITMRTMCTGGWVGGAVQVWDGVGNKEGSPCGKGLHGGDRVGLPDQGGLSDRLLHCVVVVKPFYRHYGSRTQNQAV